MASERDELRKVFEDQDLRSGAEPVHLGWERDQAQEILDRAERRVDGLQELRDQTSLLQFRERARLDDLLTEARKLRDHHRERCELATAAHDLAEGRFDDWLGKYGNQAGRLVAADHELANASNSTRSPPRTRGAYANTRLPDRELPAPGTGPIPRDRPRVRSMIAATQNDAVSRDHCRLGAAAHATLAALEAALVHASEAADARPPFAVVAAWLADLGFVAAGRRPTRSVAADGSPRLAVSGP